jgi:hypothetical protein
VRVEKVEAGNTDGFYALFQQVSISPGVAQLAVLLTVDLHAQRRFRAVEVEMVRADRNLCLEKEAELPFSQCLPENLFADGALTP